MNPYTGVLVTEEAGGAPGAKSARRTYYVHVEAEDGNAAKQPSEDRYRLYWSAIANMQVVKENWNGPDRAPKPDITDVLEGHVQPSKTSLEGNLHPVVIPLSWRKPHNVAPDPDARG